MVSCKQLGFFQTLVYKWNAKDCEGESYLERKKNSQSEL